MNGTQRDDIVLWIVIAFCLLTPVILVTIWAYYERFFPPMLLSVLLGIAVAALTYRYLGGTQGSQFSVGVLKLAGSAALLMGTAYLTNVGLSEQMDSMNSAQKLIASKKDIASLNSKIQTLNCDFDAMKIELEIAKRNKTEISILELEKLTPDSLLGAQLVALARKHKGPFAGTERVIQGATVTMAGYVKKQGTFYACDDLELADKAVRFIRVLEGQQSLDQPALVKAKQAGLISAAVCQKQNRQFAFQLSCMDGKTLFPEHISGCGDDGAVKWTLPNQARIFQVSVEVLAAEY